MRKKVALVLCTFILTAAVFSFPEDPQTRSLTLHSGTEFLPRLFLSPPVQVNRQGQKETGKSEKNGDYAGTKDAAQHGANPAQPDPRTLRAFIECGLIMGVSQANYWRRYIDWVEDWQFKFNWNDQTRRLFTGDGWRFDSNSFFTNWGHVMSGAIYYNAFRTNYHSWSRSLFYASLMSFYWELLVEWREVISINDNIFTTLGGFPIGEALFQTGSFLQSRSGWPAKLMGGVLNPFRAFNRWLDRKQSFPGPEFSTHRFRLYAGHRSGENLAGEQHRSFAEFGLIADLVRVPGFGRPGEVKEWRSDILSTYLGMQFLVGSDGLEEYEILARTMPWGWVWQNLAPVADWDVQGHSLVAGAVMAFELYGQRQYWEYDQKNPFFQPWDYEQIPLPTRFSDKYSAIHLIGPRIEWRYHGRGFNWTTAAETTVDFAMTGAFALNDYTNFQLRDPGVSERFNPLEGTKSTLANYGYYYGLGLSFSLELELRLDSGIEWSAWAKAWMSNSIEGLDRFDEEIDDSLKIRDSRSRLGTALGYRIPHSALGIRLIFEHVSRRGEMSDVVSRERDSRLSMHLRYGF
ncbi:MAG: DUF3943 domain-containing protein [Candidatus Aminicenantes bacterium]|nr:DUF3943 domain-containing protein [Candidatus Aminicenantes bacterium]